jgi:DNA replication protein DnaC
MHGLSGQGGRVGAAKIPKDYRQVTLSNSPARGNQKEAYKEIEKYVDTFDRQFSGGRIKSLYLYSESPGTGKTTTAVAIANEYLIKHYIGSLYHDRQVLQRPVFFFDVNEWQQLYNGFNRPAIPADIAGKAATEYYRWEQFAKETPFVIFDDIGIRTATDPFRADLHSVINYRVSNRLPAVYTSNVHYRRLTLVFDERLADRVREQCCLIEFEGVSKRGLRE